MTVVGGQKITVAGSTFSVGGGITIAGGASGTTLSLNLKVGDTVRVSGKDYVIEESQQTWSRHGGLEEKLRLALVNTAPAPVCQHVQKEMILLDVATGAVYDEVLASRNGNFRDDNRYTRTLQCSTCGVLFKPTAVPRTAFEGLLYGHRPEAVRLHSRTRIMLGAECSEYLVYTSHLSGPMTLEWKAISLEVELHHDDRVPVGFVDVVKEDLRIQRILVASG